MENKKNKWFTEVCDKVIEKRHVVTENYIRSDNQISKEISERERKNCTRVLQKEKGVS